MAEAIVLIQKAFPTAIYLEQTGFATVEFESNELQCMRVECPNKALEKLNLADGALLYDIEIRITERAR